MFSPHPRWFAILFKEIVVADFFNSRKRSFPIDLSARGASVKLNLSLAYLPFSPTHLPS